MGINIKLADEATKIAKRMATMAGLPESMYEMFLSEAYDLIRSGY